MENRRCKTSQKKKNMSSPPPPPLPRLPGKVSRQNGGASVVVQWVVDVRGDYPEVTKTKQLAQFVRLFLSVSPSLSLPSLPPFWFLAHLVCFILLSPF